MRRVVKEVEMLDCHDDRVRYMWARVMVALGKLAIKVSWLYKMEDDLKATALVCVGQNMTRAQTQKSFANLLEGVMKNKTSITPAEARRFARECAEAVAGCRVYKNAA